ncbi:uncharacterized protein LOC130633903 [Hydractinia symbiolongicarpus]|uniref:uncharacterized protein LOC130633903 n=1 Tax=Hydractinia symbiolongicarpus TaxID=13093 RepID=UPI00254F0037|nr:uncharacterized protein LOC130633903 [Hydractinia symbiolongicarpus]
MVKVFMTESIIIIINFFFRSVPYLKMRTYFSVLLQMHCAQLIIRLSVDMGRRITVASVIDHIQKCMFFVYILATDNTSVSKLESLKQLPDATDNTSVSKLESPKQLPDATNNTSCNQNDQQ